VITTSSSLIQFSRNNLNVYKIIKKHIESRGVLSTKEKVLCNEYESLLKYDKDEEIKIVINDWFNTC